MLPSNFCYIDEMFESHKKTIFYITVLNLSFLFPNYAFAHTIGAFDGLFLVGPILIPFSNIIKAIIIKLISPHKVDIPLGKTLLFVIIIEIFIFVFSYSIIIIIKDTMIYKGLIQYDEFTEIYWVFSLIILYGVLSILPNFSLVKEKNQSLKEIAASSYKIVYATMLAAILPAMLIFMLGMG